MLPQRKQLGVKAGTWEGVCYIYMEIKNNTAGVVDTKQFTQEDAQELTRLMTRFVTAYGEKTEEQTDEDWLKDRFLSELPEMEELDAADLSRRTIEAIREYDENLTSLRAAWKSGRTTSEWFAKRTVGSELSKEELTDRLETAYTTLAQENGIEGVQNAGTSDLRSLAKAVGSQAELAGLRSASELSAYALEDDKLAGLVEPMDAVAQALESGHDAGYKAATAGAFKVAAEKALVPFLPPKTPAEVTANLACVVVERTKTLQKAANRTILDSEAAKELAAQTVIATVSGICGKAAKVVTDTALAVVGVPKMLREAVSSVSGTAVQVLTRTVGNTFKEPIKKVVSSVASAAKKMVGALLSPRKKDKPNVEQNKELSTLFH